jgi:drug/metabolite transporter (DMT)-like permease
MAFVALGVIWGIPYFFIKLSLQELSPAVVACSRLVLATAVLLPIAWHRGALRSLSSYKWAIGAFALVEFIIPFTAICYGERWISSSATGILIATVPLWIALLSRWFGVHEPLGLWRLLGLALGFIGVATLLGFGTISGFLGWAGVGCMLIATLGYAAGPLIIQRHLGGLDSFGPLAASLLIATLVMAVPALLALPDHMPSAVALGSIVILGVICTALAMLLMFFLVADAGASRSSVITYINPAVAALLGTVILHERLGLGGIAAFALILLGSWLATRGKAAHRVSAKAMSNA